MGMSNTSSTTMMPAAVAGYEVVSVEATGDIGYWPIIGWDIVHFVTHTVRGSHYGYGGSAMPIALGIASIARRTASARLMGAFFQRQAAQHAGSRTPRNGLPPLMRLWPCGPGRRLARLRWAKHEVKACFPCEIRGGHATDRGEQHALVVSKVEAQISKKRWGGPRRNSGGKRPGSGRKPGTPNKITAEIKELAHQYGPDALQELFRLAKHAESEQRVLRRARKFSTVLTANPSSQSTAR